MSKRGQRTPWATQGTPRDCRGGVQISSAAASAGQTLSQRKSQGDRPREVKDILLAYKLHVLCFFLKDMFNITISYSSLCFLNFPFDFMENIVLLF